MEVFHLWHYWQTRNYGKRIKHLGRVSFKRIDEFTKVNLVEAQRNRKLKTQY